MIAAYVLAQIGAADARGAIDSIRSVEGVKQAHEVLGPTDCIAFIEAPDMGVLVSHIGAIRSVEGIESTDTRLVAY